MPSQPFLGHPLYKRTYSKSNLNCLVSPNFQLFRTITQLLGSDSTANILAGLNFQAQENGLMSPDGVCAISVGLAGHDTTQQSVRRACFGCMKLIEYLTSLVHLIQAFISKSYTLEITFGTQ